MPVHTYKAGSAARELALMYNCPRAATVKTSVAGQLWARDQVTFVRRLVMAANMHVLDDQASGSRRPSILSPLTDERRADLAGALIEETFEDGEYIVSAGEAADSLDRSSSAAQVVAHKKVDGKGGTEKDIMRMRTGAPNPPARETSPARRAPPAAMRPAQPPPAPPQPPRRQAPSSARARSAGDRRRAACRRTWWRWGR